MSRFDPEVWDRLSRPDDLQAKHRFVRVCEAAAVEEAAFRHVLVEDREGPVAIASLCAFSVHLDLLAPRWARRLAAAVPGLGRVPLVIAGLPVSFNQSCLRARDDVDPAEVLGVVDARARAFAAETGARVLCFKEFSSAQRDAVEPGLSAHGYAHAFSLPSCSVELPFSSFDGYLGAMRSGYRRQARATLDLRAEAGWRVRLSPLGSEVDRILPLYDQVIDRAEHRLERLNVAFFREMALRMPEAHALLLEDPDGCLLCAAVLLRGPTRTTFLISGIDYAASRPVRGYEALTLAVVEQAIRWGSATVELGQTSLPLKTRFGARVAPRHLYFRHLGPLGGAILPLLLPVAFPERRAPQRRVFRERA